MTQDDLLNKNLLNTYLCTGHLGVGVDIVCADVRSAVRIATVPGTIGSPQGPSADAEF